MTAYLRTLSGWTHDAEMAMTRVEVLVLPRLSGFHAARPAFIRVLLICRLAARRRLTRGLTGLDAIRAVELARTLSLFVVFHVGTPPSFRTSLIAAAVGLACQTA